MPETPPARSAASRWRERLGLALIAGAILWSYAFLATNHLSQLFIFWKNSADSGGYYAYQVDGFLHGQLAMRTDPPPALATLANPYDPLERARIGQMGLHDASYYKGRYYLYFGVAPALVLFLPFRLLTGYFFPEELATILFCAGGFLASLALFLGFRRRYFPAAGTGAACLGAVLLGLGNFCLVMLARNAIWEVPIAAAYFFSCLGYGFLLRAQDRGRWRAVWLAAAGIALALAVGSRPHFALAAGVVSAWLLWGEWSRRRERRGAGPWLELSAFFAPLALAAAGLLAYNYRRFGDPLEFGQKYLLAGLDQSHAKMLSARFFPENFYYYFIAPAQFQRYFPFVDVVHGYRGVRPEGYAGAEDPYGVLVNMPFCWLALAAPFVWARRFRARSGLGSWLALFTLSFLTLAGIVMCFFSAANRYMVDFIPSLQLAAALGMLMLVSQEGWTVRTGRWLRAGMVAVVAYTAWFNVFVGFAHNGMFEAHRPAAYRALAAWFDRPVMEWEQWRHQPYGPMEMTVRFSRSRPDRAEPLLVTGVAFRSDYLYAYCDPDSRTVRLGYTRTNYGQTLSQPIPLDLDAPHRITIESGTLYPPVNHPFFKHWTPEKVAAAKHTLRVSVDGVPYLDERRDFFETTPGFIEVGRNDLSNYIESRFDGQILSVSRHPPGSAIAAFAGGGFVRLAFILPGGAAGRREPLLVATGLPGAGDLLAIAEDDATHVRLGYLHAGAPPEWSDPLPVVPDQIQLLEASLGSFYPHPRDAAERELAQVLVVRLNGRLVWAEPRAFHPMTGPQVVFGANTWRSGGCGAAFTGRIVAVQPMDSPLSESGDPYRFEPYWLPAGSAPAYGALRMRVKLPARRPGQFEPLLVTGPSIPQADYVWIRYQEDLRSVLLGYEHTSGGGPNSGVFAIDFARPHLIEISVPSLYPPQGDDYFKGLSFLAMLSDKNRALIRVDGETRVDAPVKSYESTPAQSTPAENHVSTTFGLKFTGAILDLERSVHSAPAGFGDQTGPLELTVSWPADVPVGQREAILSTGSGEERDLLLIAYDSPGSAHWIVRDHQGRTFAGEPWSVAPGGSAVVRVAWGGFYPDSARPTAIRTELWHSLQGSFAIEMTGTEAFRGSSDFILADPEEVALGSSPADLPFSGAIRAARRLPAGNP